MSPTAEEMRLRERVVERVTSLARATFGDGAAVLPFGSQVTGLCLPGSDVDFVIRLPSAPAPGGDAVDDGTNASAEAVADNPLRRFADAVLDEYGTRSELLVEDDLGRGGARDCDDDDDDDDDDEEGDDSDHAVGADAADAGGGREYLSYLEVIEQTRVPLVKFTIAPHGIDVDVCFDQPHGPESADLMHRFMESMPPLRPLTFVLKYFLASRDINKPFTGGIGSYLLQLMIVSYLQHRAREDVSRRHGADGRHYNLGSLLLDFLELYGVDFNYVTTGISVRHDGYYFPKGLKERRESFWQPSRPFGIAMENPLDPTADVGAGAFRMQMIQRIFGHAFRTLLAYVSEPAEPTDSILARIIPPTEEMERRMIAKRRGVPIAVVDDGPEDDDEEDEFGPSDHGGNNLGPKRRKTGGTKERRRRKSSSRNDDDRDNGKGERSIQGGIQGDGGKNRGKKRVRNST
ncbi:hypothetical protein ACHAW5_008099 [Stephanodiscus triporus]|uniref:PAP-associated domain-containing protein n=1 Tax=Stephanodiscus triporus TaxID=2934178 RepID=A0ABD3ML45_9STRA